MAGLSENRVLGQFEALRSGATPLVGRDEEMGSAPSLGAGEGR